MSGAQVGSAIALAVIGLLLIVISASSRDSLSKASNFGDHLSKIGLFVGGFFMLPLVLIVMITIIVGGEWAK